MTSHPLQRPRARPAPPSGVRAVALLGLLALVGIGGCGAGEEPTTPVQGIASYDADGWRAPSAGVPERLPNVVVIVLDTLRADAVTGRGGRPGRMPFLSSLGRAGTEFRRAIAPASWTMPSLSSFLTGLAPHQHRCVELGARVDVPRSVTTFAEALGRGYGYETAAFVGLPPHAISSSIFDGFPSVTSEFSLQAVETVVVPWARRRDARRPFLLLLHTYDAHEPYGRENQAWPRQGVEEAFAGGNPLEVASGPWDVVHRCLLDWRACRALRAPRHRALQEAYLACLWSGLAKDPQTELVEELRQAYEEGVAWVDGLLEGAVARLRAVGLLKNTVLVVTSDHGEAFGEHGILLHGRQLYEELVHIPLVIVPYGVEGGSPFAGPRTVESCVGLVDVFPTLFAAAGLAPVGERQGRSFLEALGETGEERPVLSEVRVTPDVTGGQADQQVMSARARGWKYILTCDFRHGVVHEELYDLVRDPSERSPVPLASVDAAALGAALLRAVEEVRDHFWRGPEASEVHCDLPGTPATPVPVGRPPPLTRAKPPR